MTDKLTDFSLDQVRAEMFSKFVNWYNANSGVSPEEFIGLHRQALNQEFIDLCMVLVKLGCRTLEMSPEQAKGAFKRLRAEMSMEK